MSDTATAGWSSGDPRRIPLTGRKEGDMEKGILQMVFVSNGPFPPPGCSPGEAELEAAVRAELAAASEAIADYASWRAKLAAAQQEENSIKLQLERADLEKRELLLAPAGSGAAARLGENEAVRRATARMLEHTSEGRQQLLKQTETARLTAERALRRIIDKCSTRLMTEAQADIEAAAQEAAAAASAALTRLGEALMRLRYCSSMGDVLALRLRHLLDEVPAPAAAPAELPTPLPPRDESPALLMAATVELPAGSNVCTVPLSIPTGQDGVVAVRVAEPPPLAPVVPDAALAQADLTPQPVSDRPALEQAPADPTPPSTATTLFTEPAATKPPRRCQRAE